MSTTVLHRCLRCDTPLTFQSEGGSRFERRAALLCPNCNEEHVLTVRLTPTRGVAA